VRNTASAFAGGATSNLLTGQHDWAGVAAQSFGQGLGNALVSMQRYGDQQRAQQQLHEQNLKKAAALAADDVFSNRGWSDSEGNSLSRQESAQLDAKYRYALASTDDSIAGSVKPPAPIQSDPEAPAAHTKVGDGDFGDVLAGTQLKGGDQSDLPTANEWSQQRTSTNAGEPPRYVYDPEKIDQVIVEAHKDSLWDGLYNISKDFVSKFDAAVGVSGLTAPHWVEQMSEARRKAMGIGAQWKTTTTKYALDNSKLISGAKTLGHYSFGISTLFAANDLYNASNDNNMSGMVKPIVDIGFGAVGLTGVGALGSVSYSLTGMFMETPFAQERITAPMVNYFTGESDLSKWQQRYITTPIVDTIWSLTSDN
jgi:hypothetical protein